MESRDGSRGVAKSPAATKGFASLSAKECPAPETPTDFRSCVPQLVSCFAVGFFNFCEGMSLSFSSSLIPALEGEHSEIPISLEQGVLLGSIMTVSMAVGALCAGMAMNYFGRMNAVRLSVIPYCAGCALVATATSYDQILVGRIVTGLSNALGASSSTVFITEAAPSHLRGALVGLFSTTLASFGVLATYVLGAYTSWRTTAWACVGPSAFSLVLMYFFGHETPIWLVSKGRTAEAEASLRAFARWNDSEDSRDSLPGRQLAWLVQRHDFAEASRVERPSWYSALLDLLRLPVGYKPLVILTLVFVAQNFSGVYITLFYAATFFQDMGSKVDMYEAAIYMGVMRFFGGLAASVLMRRYGVRQLLITSSFCMAVCMVLSGYFTLYPSKGHDGWVAVGLVLLYVVCSCCGLLTVPWTMTAEVFPDQLRDAGQAVMVGTSYAIMFIALESYPALRSAFHLGAVPGSVGIQWFFAAVALVGVVFAFLFLPETRNKTLQEVEEHYKHHTLWLGRDRGKKKAEKGLSGSASASAVTAEVSVISSTALEAAAVRSGEKW